MHSDTDGNSTQHDKSSWGFILIQWCPCTLIHGSMSASRYYGILPVTILMHTLQPCDTEISLETSSDIVTCIMISVTTFIVYGALLELCWSRRFSAFKCLLLLLPVSLIITWFWIVSFTYTCKSMKSVILVNQSHCECCTFCAILFFIWNFKNVRRT